MKRTLRVYKKTVSIVNETAIGMYQNLVGNKAGFLLESYDKNYDRYTFMGANTYIGNAPNFMVKSIAEENGIRMPSFFGYMTWSLRFLIPVFIIDMLIFFL